MLRSVVLGVCALSLLAHMACGADQDQQANVEVWRQRLLAGNGTVPEAASALSVGRNAVAQAVTQIITDGQMRERHPEVVGVAMTLAGDLELAACIPALERNIRFWVTEPSTITPEHIESYPAALALSQIGFASFPALLSLVKGGDPDERTLATWALERSPHKSLILDVLKAEKSKAASQVAAEMLESTIVSVDTARKDEERAAGRTPVP